METLVEEVKAGALDSWVACYLHRDNQDSYYLPGRVDKLVVQCLIDTGCTTNILAKHVFDKLPASKKSDLEECHSSGTMADGTRLSFYGVVKIPLKLRGVYTEEAFVVCCVNEDIILGMPYLTKHKCSMDFARGCVVVEGRELMCTDKHGRFLTTKVQVVKEVVIPPCSESTVLGRVTAKRHWSLGLVEGREGGPLVAASISRPDTDGRLLLRCMNLTNQPLCVNAGSVVGSFVGVDEADVEDPAGVQIGSMGQATECLVGTENEVPEHLKALFEAARVNCQTELELGQLAALLREHGSVFSTGDF